ncbi:MAG: U32 family peptidase [Mycoplasmoidaceae bacterium]
MKIVTNCWDFDSFFKIIESKIEKIRIGINGISSKFNGYFNIDDLHIITLNRGNTQISIAINRFFQENEIEFLEESIKKIVKYDIQEISFCDFAIAQICKENNIKIKLNYNPESIMSNYEQILFFQKNNINSFVISNILTHFEVLKFLKNKNNSEVEMQVFGQTLFMISSWPLVSNFKEYLEKKQKTLPSLEYYIIKENNRDIPNYIKEENGETLMYSGFILNLSKKIPSYIEQNLDYIFIEPIFKNIDWLFSVINIFKDLINSNIDPEDAYKKLENNCPELIHSESFLGDIDKLPHLKRELDD